MTQQQRWQARKTLAWLTRVFVFVLPIVAAVVAATVVATSLPEPTTPLATVGWWAAVLGASFLTAFVVDKLARRLLPLAALLNLSLVFPDEAPSRFRVALRTWSTGRIQREIVEARARGVDDDPTLAAEFALSLVASLSRHDRLTRGHAERTRAYTDLLAEEMGLSDEDRDRLRWAALLHDIGKVRIAADILNKEEPLGHEEWDHVRQHPQLGFDLIAPIREFLGPWAETILHHHERFDGTGYPQGLSGTNIALGARIVSVADAYDAMTAVRSYQPALSTRVAMKELANGAGKHFDPAVVRAFLRISVGAVRRVAGPLVLLAQLPFIGGVRRVVDSAATVGAGVIAVAALFASGGVPDGVADPIEIELDVAALVAAQLDAVAAASNSGSFDPAALDLATLTISRPPGNGSAEVVDGRIVYTGSPPDSFVYRVCDTAGSCEEFLVALDAAGVVDQSVVLAIADGPAGSASVSSVPPPTTVTNNRGATSSTAVASSTTTEATRPDGATTSTTSPAPTTTTTTTTTSTTTSTTTTTPPANRPPLVVNDSFDGVEDEAITVDVLANDVDPEDRLDPTSLTIVSEPTMGDADVVGSALGAAPLVRYTPAADATGVDSFGYEVCDLDGACGVAVSVVRIAAVNDPPVAVADVVVTDEDVAVVVDVVANDRDVDNPRRSLTATVLVPPTRGEAALDGAELTYVPDPDAYGVDVITYQLCDPAGGCGEAVVSVTVEAVNDPPLAQPDEIVGSRDGTVVIDVLANDQDIDGDVVTIETFDEMSSQGGTVACDRVCTYTPPGDWGEDDTFSYTIGDGAGGSATALVTVRVPSDSSDRLYLKAAGPGAQMSAPLLPLSPDPVPTNNNLPNYDVDRDKDDGLILDTSDRGLAEDDPTRYQLWTHASASAYTVAGSWSLDLWAAMSDFSPADGGRLEAFLLACPATTTTGADCEVLGSGSVDRHPWSPASGSWQEISIGFGPVAGTVSPGDVLALKIVVSAPDSDGPLRLAFDAVGFEASVGPIGLVN